MRLISLFAAAVLSTASLTAFATQTETSPTRDTLYLVDVMKDSALAADFARLTAPVAEKSPWIRAYGTASPAVPILIDNTSYLVFQGCEPHNCPEQSYAVLYEPSSKKIAAGAFVSNHYNDRQEIIESRITWLGQPDFNQVTTLSKFLY